MKCGGWATGGGGCSGDKCRMSLSFLITHLIQDIICIHKNPPKFYRKKFAKSKILNCIKFAYASHCAKQER